MLAYHIKPELVSTWQPWYWYQTFAKEYAVQLESVPNSDPFECWRTTWRSAQRSLGSLHPAARRALLPSQISCCFVSAEFRPKCFGVIPQRRLSDREPQGYVWYHPHNCCGSQPLAATLQKHMRCALPRQKVWRVAIAQALTETSSGLGARKIVQATSGPRRLRELALSRAAPCPAAAALLQAVSTIRSLRGAPSQADDEAFFMQDVGRHDKHCSIYGHDSAACCLVQICKADRSGRRCVACLLAEVPWGTWTRNQRLLLAALLQAVTSSRPFSTSVPHFRDTFHQLLDAGADEPAKEPSGISAPRLVPLLMILSVVIRLTGRRKLYSALHSLQVAAPLRLLSPEDLANALQVLSQAPLAPVAQPARCSARLREGRQLQSSASSPACGAAVAAFIAVYHGSRGSRCCPGSVWPALLRAAAEGGDLARWPTAVLARCLLCEVKLILEPSEVHRLDALVDRSVTCLGKAECPWHNHTCGHELWAPILGDIRDSMLCSLSSQPLQALRADEPALSVRGKVSVKNHAETMQHLLSGGSLMRFNDGEQLQLNVDMNGPLARYTDSLIRLSFAVRARCPGLCVGLVHPDDLSTLGAIGQSHLEWWREAGLPNTRKLLKSGLLPEQGCQAELNSCCGHLVT